MRLKTTKSGTWHIRFAKGMLVLHTCVVLIAGTWAMLAQNNEERWIRSQFLYWLDFPLIRLYGKLMYDIVETPFMVIVIPGVFGGALYFSVGWGLGLAVDRFARR